MTIVKRKHIWITKPKDLLSSQYLIGIFCNTWLHIHHIVFLNMNTRLLLNSDLNYSYFLKQKGVFLPRRCFKQLKGWQLTRRIKCVGSGIKWLVRCQLVKLLFVWSLSKYSPVDSHSTSSSLHLCRIMFVSSEEVKQPPSSALHSPVPSWGQWTGPGVDH